MPHISLARVTAYLLAQSSKSAAFLQRRNVGREISMVERGKLKSNASKELNKVNEDITKLFKIILATYRENKSQLKALQNNASLKSEDEMLANMAKKFFLE